MAVNEQRAVFYKNLADIRSVIAWDPGKAISRNPTGYCGDLGIQLTEQELSNLIFRSGTSSWGGTRKAPRAFTEQGVAMLSSVLRSERSVQVNIEVMRAFVRLRQVVGSHRELAKRLDDLEKKYDSRFKIIFDAIRELMAPKELKRESIGFSSHKKK